jgi:hypothetical protein
MKQSMKVKAGKIRYATIGLACLVVLVFLARETTPGQSLLRIIAGGPADQVPTTRTVAAIAPPAAVSGDLYQLRKTIRELETKIAKGKRLPGTAAGGIAYNDAKRTFESEESMLRQMTAILEKETQAGGTDASLLELRKAVRQQEDTVEQCRRVLANIVRATSIVYRGDESDPVTDQAPAARRHELEADQATLRQLKLELRNWAPAAEGEQPSTPSD